jgi:hypothetical protein
LEEPRIMVASKKISKDIGIQLPYNLAYSTLARAGQMPSLWGGGTIQKGVLYASYIGHTQTWARFR